jgi:superfamily II DNA/RNA helicase
VSHLEFLIGYFRISGFVKIAPYLEHIEKARILVGINVDAVIAEAKARGKKPNLFDGTSFRQSFIDEQKEVLQTANYSKEVDSSIEILLSMLSQNRLELRISKDKNIHAKIYILREKEFIKHDGSIDYKGSVITGSSNLSANGLSSNYEFNVELRDSDEIKYSLEEFESLWSQAIEITDGEIDTIKQESYLREITPFELYLKFLIEHFGDRVNYDASVAEDLPKGFMKLAYQIDAVNEGLAKIKKHSGFFLSDVVGLGKTITTAMIVKRLLFDTKGQVLIIAPPSIRKEWYETFKRFQIGAVRKYDFYSYAELYKIKDSSEYEIVIVDESHKFKNFATSRYVEIERICKEDSKFKKKIILVSATPLNNKPQDLANQLYLFQSKRKSTIDSFPNLESFFAKIDKEYKAIIRKDKNKTDLSPEDMQKLKELSARVRENILREVMVRRTRTDIQSIKRYSDDILAQGLKIPRINEVQELEYYLDDELTKVFYESIDILMEQLEYARYKAIGYLAKKAKAKFGEVQEGFFERSAENLAKIMQTMLVKRLESSFHAFKSTINKQRNNLKAFLQMFDDGQILIPTSKINLFEILEENEDDIEDVIEKLIASEKIKDFVRDEFTEGYYELLKKDLFLLDRLVEIWDKIDKDPKVDRFKEILASNKKDKLVVFTESKQTAIYLQSKLQDDRILVVHGANRDELKDTIRENFDANYENKKDDYSTIISTDTLSEGVNMHRSNIIYNYDIPWNSTRLMQRIGRINRIGTKHDEIFIYNFKPTAQSEKLIELSKKAYIKLQTFHHSLGEDSKIYTKDEEVGTVSLFEENTESQIDEELPFLEEIREFKEANPKRYTELLKLPQKMRVQRKSADDKKQSFVFIKNSDSKSYYHIQNSSCTAVNFALMANNLKAKQDENQHLPIDEAHYADVALALSIYEGELMSTIAQSQAENIKVEHKTDKEAIGILKSWFDKGFLSDDLFDMYLQIVKEGKILNISKEIVKISKDKNIKPFEIMAQMDKLAKRYTLNAEADGDEAIDIQIDIILSESFV